VEIGKKVRVWGGVFSQIYDNIAMQYGTECVILMAKTTPNGNIYSVLCENEDNINEDWAGWVHEKQIEWV
jgi:hypothetical protein